MASPAKLSVILTGAKIEHAEIKSGWLVLTLDGGRQIEISANSYGDLRAELRQWSEPREVDVD